MDEYDIERRFEELEREIRIVKNQNKFLIQEIEKRNFLIQNLLIKLNQKLKGERKWQSQLLF